MIGICGATKESRITSLNLSIDRPNITGIMAICDLLENHDLKNLILVFDELTDEFMEIILASIEKSELIIFHSIGTFNLSKSIKRKMKETMPAQKCKAAQFNKMKSANTNANASVRIKN